MRLAALRRGQVELNEAEQRVLETASALKQSGQTHFTRAMWARLRGLAPAESMLALSKDSEINVRATYLVVNCGDALTSS